MAGERDKVEGTIKEAAGKVTGDHDTEAEGKGQKASGKVQDAAHSVGEKAKDVIDKVTP